MDCLAVLALPLIPLGVKYCMVGLGHVSLFAGDTPDAGLGLVRLAMEAQGQNMDF